MEQDLEKPLLPPKSFFWELYGVGFPWGTRIMVEVCRHIGYLCRHHWLLLQNRLLRGTSKCVDTQADCVDTTGYYFRTGFWEGQ
ncbi:hypothetical protein Taro_025380 [Colocasia esculenta]|uniref:Uncharacterized protein n=1 Tax=Colocasia esculenta TaxID=4460 RepID=A0A843VC25_COLES|nr:hypothetical protein [Colocasia esculenta]